MPKQKVGRSIYCEFHYEQSTRYTRAIEANARRHPDHEEIKGFVEAYQAGSTIKDVARAFNRSWPCVRGHLRRLGVLR